MAPSAIRSVSVPRVSEFPKKKQVVFATTGQAAAVVTSAVVGGLVGGAIAAAVSAGATSDERQLITDRFPQTGTDPGLIVATEWERQIKASGFYPLVPAGGDAEFRFEVQQIGLVGSGSKLYPALSGQLKFVRRDGKVLWSEFGDAEGKDRRLAMIGHSFAQYMSDPLLLRTSTERVAQIFCTDLLERFREEYRAASQDDADARRDQENKAWSRLPKAERKAREQARDAAEKEQVSREKAEDKARVQARKQTEREASAERSRATSTATVAPPRSSGR